MGHFIVPNQYFDHARGRRAGTFFGDGLVGHVSTAESACQSLGQGLRGGGQLVGSQIRSNKTFAVIEGPCLGSRAASHFLRDAVRADIVGMTNIPEVFLARKAQICYAS